VTGQKRRPGMNAPAASKGIVSIGAKGNYRPDHKRLASGHVAAARAELRMSYAEFAAHLSVQLGWTVSAATLERWERESTPPGDVVSACYAITRGDGGADVPLLAAVPPAFSVEALAGPWVTAYQFGHDGDLLYHADIAHVAAESASRIRAVNHPPEPRSEGRARSFRNEIDATLAGRHLIGEWQNTSDTRYYGTVQLAVLPGETVMRGWFCGVGSDVEVSNGLWKWVRLAADPAADLAGITLREPAELHDLVMTHGQNDPPLLLAEVREKF
jgi:hypothetical protein